MTNITYENRSFIVEGTLLDLQLTLVESAQVFHWREDANGHFSAVVAGRAVSVIPRENGFLLENVMPEDEAFWRNYFDMDRDYDAIADSLEELPIARQAMNCLPGLRVLNQPVWEALIAFILSANNNVPRIRMLAQKISSLSEKGGFPSADELSEVSEAELRRLGCGYRAPYLRQTARMVREGFDLEELRTMTYEEAHRRLLMLPGVGDKVADCVQLFGLGQSEAFPVDVWVERLMKSWFVPDARNRREVCVRAHELFGAQAGIVQQSLFHCARMGLISL